MSHLTNHLSSKFMSITRSYIELAPGATGAPGAIVIKLFMVVSYEYS
jgi:hypothetical protein